MAMAASAVMPPPPTPADPPPPTLLDRMRAAIRLRHFIRRTEEAYVGWVRPYILFHHKRHPVAMGEAEVTTFLTHLAEERRVSASTQNQAFCAVLFLYRHVLDRPLGQLHGLVWAKHTEHVPVVLTREEVVAVLAHMSGPCWLAGALLYGAGLRLSECLELRVKDLDIAGGQIVMRSGKGGRDRRTMRRPNLPRSARGRAVAIPSARVCRSAGRDRRRAPCGTDQACDLPFIPPFICDASSRRRLGHPDRTGTVGAQGCEARR